MSGSAPPGAKKWRRRLKGAAVLVLAAASTSTMAAVPASAQQPVGVGPLPITFHIKDDNGKWFDSGLNLFGGQSLAVAEMPRVGTSALDGTIVPRLPDGGGLLPSGLPGIPANSGAAQQQAGLLNTGMGASLNGLVKGVGQAVPALGQVGQNLADVLNLDFTLNTVRQIGASNPQAAPLAAKAEGLLGQFTAQVAGLPADAPINLNSLPVGVDLQGVLNGLTQFAVEGPPVTVKFVVDPNESEGLRNPMGLIAPEGAKGFPYMDAKGAFFGERQIQLTEPGLYAFADMVSPYMLGAVVVDDPLTIGLDFGKRSQINSRELNVPTHSDIVNRLVNTFFNITNPNNWQKFNPAEKVSWNPTQAPVPILQYDEFGNPVLIPILDAYFDSKFKYPKTLNPDKLPATPGVGEVWIDTEMEEFAEKDKVGSATRINTENWEVERKIGAPGVNMNNPHNMWTDKDYKYLYQSEWFDDEIDVFDRETGKHLKNTQVGHNPAHIMTKVGTDELIVGLNAGNEIVQVAPGGGEVTKRINVSPSGEIRHPHAHWLSYDGKTVITPNVMTDNASIIDLDTGEIKTEKTGQFPIASSMTSDAKTAYTADFTGQSITCVSLKEDACADGSGKKVHSKQIDLWENYSPVTGPTEGKPFGGLAIQLPVSPDDKALVAANVLSQTVSVVDPKTNKVVKDLPCAAGCHGINFGAKKGGGYYAYVSNKFANVMQIIDVDPNGDGNIADAAVVGQKNLSATPNTKVDGTITGASGMGGQGVLPIPLVYNGWAQQNSGKWAEKLTPQQLDPIGTGK